MAIPLLTGARAGRPTLLAKVSYRARCAWARCACRCPTYMRHCAFVLRAGSGEESILLIQRSQNAGGVAREKTEAVEQTLFGRG